ncbi:MAG: phosphate uptake regulator PhoU [Chloroflexi bacterium]|nr:phosphate uptake regulator PhoU [Chloroflexota bacterium]
MGEDSIELRAPFTAVLREFQDEVVAFGHMVGVAVSQAEGICKNNVMLDDESLVRPLIDIPRMAATANGLLSRSREASVERDVEKAKRVSHEDDAVDALRDQMAREFISFLIEDSCTMQRGLYLSRVSHNLERTAERVTNICERVDCIVTGEMEGINASM